MFERITDPKEKKEAPCEYIFSAEQSELPYAFIIHSTPNSLEKSVYATVHFDGNAFRSPDNKSEIEISDFVA